MHIGDEENSVDKQSVIEYGIERTVELLNRGFAGYFVPVQLNLSSFAQMVAHDSLDLALSRVALLDGQGVGVTLIARRGWTSRLAAMAVVPDARGQGVGGALMEALIAEARSRGDRAMVLEVIAGNEPALRLYQKCGFVAVRELWGFVAENVTVEGEAALQEIDIRLIADLVGVWGLPDLPWQVSAETLAQAGPPSRGFQLDDAYAVISNPEREQIALRCVLVKPESRRQGQAKRLLRALMAQYPGRIWRVPAICPQECAPLFESLGFEREPLSQVQMRLALDWEQAEKH